MLTYENLVLNPNIKIVCLNLVVLEILLQTFNDLKF